MRARRLSKEAQGTGTSKELEENRIVSITRKTRYTIRSTAEKMINSWL